MMQRRVDLSGVEVAEAADEFEKWTVFFCLLFTLVGFPSTVSNLTVRAVGAAATAVDGEGGSTLCELPSFNFACLTEGE